jgi:ubiquinone/menaquinone biosynthesis C-methylase UbiE
LQRVTSTEFLDDDLGTPAEIARSFDDLWHINRWLGGVSTNMHLLKKFFARTGQQSARILEVGAGDSRLAGRLRLGLKRRHVSAEFVVLDRRASHLLIGNPSSMGLQPVVADVFNLPFAEETFDVVMCNLFFHHFSGGAARDLLRRLAAVARKAVIVNDLERHALAHFFIRIGYPFARSRITRHDGPASVRQAYTKGELRNLAQEAGFREFEVERLIPFRLGLTLWKKPLGAVN